MKQGMNYLTQGVQLHEARYELLNRKECNPMKQGMNYLTPGVQLRETRDELPNHGYATP